MGRKKSLAALVVLGGLALPFSAQVATAAPGAVDDVKLAWAGGKVKVSWTESTDVANTVALEIAGKPLKALGSTTVGGANELLVPASALEPSADAASSAKIVVGGNGEARSAAFDRFLGKYPPYQPAMIQGALNWSFAPEPVTDATPNDPLDVGIAPKYQPQVTALDVADCRVTTLPAGENGTIPASSKPYNVKWTAQNEWGSSPVVTYRMRTSTTTFAAPASTVVGQKLTMTATTTLRGLQEKADGTCVEGPETGGFNLVDMSLQARNSATSAWYSVGVVHPNAQGITTFTVTNPGAREYRAATGEGALGGYAQTKSLSGSEIVRATTHVESAKFITLVIAYGTQPQAYLWVDPAGAQQAALQFKNAAGAWQGVGYKTLASGRGLLTFPWSIRGTTDFRWWVPASKSSTGLDVDAVYSPVFTLTVQ
jgi:hypothetical protein